MILKLILIAVVLFAVYKLTGGSLTPPSEREEEHESDTDALEECHTCGTYVTRKESIRFRGIYYCSPECLPK